MKTMTNLYLPATADTPEINFDCSANTLSLFGESYPENGNAFFSPIFHQLQNHLQTLNGEAFLVNFRLIYFNSMSAKMLYVLFQLLDVYARAHPNAVVVNWHYDEDDDMAADFCQDLREEFSHIVVNMHAETTPAS